MSTVVRMLGAPVRATHLLPFVQPDLCIITMGNSSRRSWLPLRAA